MHKMCQIPHPHRRLRLTRPGHFNYCLSGIYVKPRIAAAVNVVALLAVCNSLT